MSEPTAPTPEETKAKKRKFAIGIGILIAAMMLFNMIILAWRL